MSKARTGSGIEENTLGVIVGRERRQREPQRTFRRSERTVSTTRANQRGLGGRDLAGGMIAGSLVMALFLVWRTIEQWTSYPTPTLAISAWLLLLVTAAGALLGVLLCGGTMPTWLFTLTLVGLAGVVTLDLSAVAAAAGLSVYPTAALAAGVMMTPLVSVRETREVMAATVTLGAVLLVAALVQERSSPLTLGPELVAIAIAVWLPFIAISVVRAFRRMVQLELDLVLVQSTVDAPRLAVGMLASEELVRLDLDAERLLDDVAEGRTALPLHPDAAGAASQLATQLRLHLVEGRKKTWLHNAITESEFLAPAVSLDDPGSLAGLLSPAQRDAMLTAVWLLVSDSKRHDVMLHIDIGPRAPSTAGSPRKIRFPVFLHATGVPRRRVDAAAWEAISNVGPHSEYTRKGDLHVEIECMVDNPVDA
ncbi:hypothetical protein [Microterricola viridarii]|uniref:Uncharacterized protein n=1 Tax=Microterricola viridarii TaxID=412690 RepID=A0A1H1R843_9MICO|nr:hypothetical protein [Microterricola viridarii]SDS31863.1 hypothetical protein SAMN04489834_1260 [Microterricola viridarii]